MKKLLFPLLISVAFLSCNKGRSEKARILIRLDKFPVIIVNSTETDTLNFDQAFAAAFENVADTVHVAVDFADHISMDAVRFVDRISTATEKLASGKTAQIEILNLTMPAASSSGIGLYLEIDSTGNIFSENKPVKLDSLCDHYRNATLTVGISAVPTVTIEELGKVQKRLSDCGFKVVLGN